MIDKFIKLFFGRAKLGGLIALVLGFLLKPLLDKSVALWLGIAFLLAGLLWWTFLVWLAVFVFVNAWYGGILRRL